MQYTVITLDEMKATMTTLGYVEATGPSTTKEYVYEKLVIENPKIIVKVYTSISKKNGDFFHRDICRGKGQDAIRVCAVNITDRIGWIKTIKVLRVAGWRSNLQKAIYRVEKQARDRFTRSVHLEQDFQSGRAWRKIISGEKPGQVRNGAWETNKSKLHIKRDECPACSGKYAKKDLFTVKMDENGPMIKYWLFQCPKCHTFLKVNNE